MRKLLLLDADVIIDLHVLGIFDKLAKAYEIFVTVEVLREARYYKKAGKKYPIHIKGKITVINNVQLDSLNKVMAEARAARLAIDQGEATSIAYLLQSEEEMRLCSFDKAAIKLISYMELEAKSVSLEKALKNVGHHTKLYPRHLEKEFKNCVKAGKALRIQYKNLI
jgi:hypothetical protein